MGDFLIIIPVIVFDSMIELLIFFVSLRADESRSEDETTKKTRICDFEIDF